MRPLIVVEASVRTVATVRREVEAAGWPVTDGWRGQTGVVCAGAVADAADAAAALLAALGGAGVLVHATAERDVIDRLVDDLRRLGKVDHRTRESAGPALTPDERELLELLGQGLTLGAASKHLHVSRRTADRRLASARSKLGVETTAEAVVRSRTATRPSTSRPPSTRS